MDNAGIAVSKDGIKRRCVAWTLCGVAETPAGCSRKTEWQAIKLDFICMAGWDEIFMNKLVEAGGWDLLDGIALHPVEEIILLIIL